MIWIFIFAMAIAILFYWTVWTEVLGAAWLPTPRKKVELTIKLARINKNDVFYDLGCGSGSILNRCKSSMHFSAWVNCIK